jgi:hypothetical protein
MNETLSSYYNGCGSSIWQAVGIQIVQCSSWAGLYVSQSFDYFWNISAETQTETVPRAGNILWHYYVYIITINSNTFFSKGVTWRQLKVWRDMGASIFAQRASHGAATASSGGTGVTLASLSLTPKNSTQPVLLIWIPMIWLHTLTLSL